MTQNQIIPRRLWKIETTHLGVTTHSLRTTGLGRLLVKNTAISCIYQFCFRVKVSNLALECLGNVEKFTMRVEHCKVLGRKIISLLSTIQNLFAWYAKPASQL